MRSHGTLSKWNDDRGFGFLSPAQGGEDLFVHISAFPRDGERPQIGELVSFEVELGKDGKPRAVKVLRPGAVRAPAKRRPTPGREYRPAGSGRRTSLITAAVVVALAVGGYRHFSGDGAGPAEVAPIARQMPASVSQPAAAASFQCDGRTQCSEMRSCEEAEYFLRNCPNVAMDGNGDGEPCEQQWCN